MDSINSHGRSINKSSKQTTRISKSLVYDNNSGMSSDCLEINFNSKAILKIIILIVFCLVIVSSLGQIYSYVLAAGTQGKLVSLFNLDAEASIPTIYSSFSLLLCSMLLAIIAKSKHDDGNRYRHHWKILSFIFLYLAIDEGAKIHEISIDITRRLLNTSGFLHFAWVIPAIILFSIFALVYLRFTLSLPNSTRFLFIFAAAIFVGGAVGIEMIGGQFVTLEGKSNLLYAMITTVEEAFEMIGVTIFIYALSKYIQDYIKPIKIMF